jgi:hypothetical protein
MIDTPARDIPIRKPRLLMALGQNRGCKECSFYQGFNAILSEMLSFCNIRESLEGDKGD